uniref:NR LBD domain-containing protein n=1 Tax=Cairina moschata TaxID=8855 RepID=A0A8C3C3Z6_CAIMO
MHEIYIPGTFSCELLGVGSHPASYSVNKAIAHVDERSWLKTPGATCRRASGVLLKTLTFVRNLPSFYHVPWEDWAVLILQNWAPLFVLGLAQEGVLTCERSTNEPGSSSLGTSLAEVQKIKNLLWKFWDLDVSTREYAYLKGIILFHSESSGSSSVTLWICAFCQLLIPRRPSSPSRCLQRQLRASRRSPGSQVDDSGLKQLPGAFPQPKLPFFYLLCCK